MAQRTRGDQRRLRNAARRHESGAAIVRGEPGRVPAMAKTTTKLLGLALAGVGAYGLWSVGTGLFGGDDEATGTKQLVNQVWIERMPKDQRDMIGHLVLVDMTEGRVGAAGKSSQWRVMVELFQWGLEGNRLSVFFPQERVKAKLEVRTWSCEGEAPKPFELCLEISNGRRKATFYSMEEWHIEPDRAEASLAELREAHPELGSVGQDVVIPVGVDDDEELQGYSEVEADALLGQ
jgi:hypothetical protein